MIDNWIFFNLEMGFFYIIEWCACQQLSISPISGKSKVSWIQEISLRLQLETLRKCFWLVCLRLLLCSTGIWLEDLQWYYIKQSPINFIRTGVGCPWRVCHGGFDVWNQKREDAKKIRSGGGPCFYREHITCDVMRTQSTFLLILT